MPGRNFHKLQMVQNTLARVVATSLTMSRRSSGSCTGSQSGSVSSSRSRRWHSKPAILVSGEPQYLASLIASYTPGRNLRSSTQGLINRCFVRTTTASRVFSCAGAALCNNLPSSVRDCKKTLTLLGSILKHICLTVRLYSRAYE
jgi:hypothetical protein